MFVSQKENGIPLIKTPGNIIPPSSVLGSGHTYESAVTLDSRLGGRSSPRRSK